MSLASALANPSRPVFLFGSTPPKEGTTEEKGREACAKFAARSAVLATDGFIVYDIQDECSRTNLERPFPFRKTMDPSQYASYFPAVSGKECVVYKSVVEESPQHFDEWLSRAVVDHGHKAFNLVGAASSAQAKQAGMSLQLAGERATARGDCKFGCVCIAERHSSKGNEHVNLFKKSEFGAEWFITQGIFASGPIIKLIRDYGDLCREKGTVPKKVILTFAPCGRPKTMTFIKWLGMHVPEEVEARMFASERPVQESINILCELLTEVLQQTKGSGVPLGINVESLSIFKEEIDAAHELFQKLQVSSLPEFSLMFIMVFSSQAILLNSYGSPWAIRWFFVDPIIPKSNDSGVEINQITLSGVEESGDKKVHAICN